MYILVKVLITAMIVLGVSEISRRYTSAAAILASLPLTTLLAFIWIYRETGDSARIGELSQSILWLQIPSAIFLLLLPMLLKTGLGFYPALLLSLMVMFSGYGAFLWLNRYMNHA